MEEPKRILAVDDDRDVRFFLESALQRVGYAVTTAASGEEALALVRDTPFDAAILDLRLEGRVDGLRLLGAIRWRWPQTATVILTGHGSLESAMTAIEEGVDAYLLKPVKIEDLRKTVQDVLDRKYQMWQNAAEQDPAHILRRGPFLADLRHRHVSRDGTPLDLSENQATLLIYMLENADKVIPPTELVRVVRAFDCEYMFEARNIIKWYIHRLRQKVEPDPSRPRHILNVRGVGYTFKT